ncbi:hypothetical protein [Fulvimarina manganoxydans]|uniref:hypothetical protein n=1 Tax=Fulvimarina manganoxydans TaxID=937218 RepID=UPI0030811D30
MTIHARDRFIVEEPTQLSRSAKDGFRGPVHRALRHDVVRDVDRFHQFEEVGPDPRTGFRGQEDIAGRIVTPDKDLVGIKPKLSRQSNGLAGAVRKQFGTSGLAHAVHPLVA